MRLADKVAIITGSGRGIGKAVALTFAAEGADIVVADIDANTAEATAAEIRGLGRKAMAISVDLCKWNEVEAMAKSAAEKLGRIDILVNNAGVANFVPRPFFQIPEDEWDTVMRINVKSMFLCCKAVFPHMKTAGRGKIVNISSGTHFLGAPGLLHYASSKGAIIGLTRSLARELGDFNITVNSVAPGLTITEGVTNLTGAKGVDEMAVNRRSIKRRQMPEDLVGAIVFLASDGSDFITGQTLVVDGGVAMH
jgi:NAD(P)-dependent dehydrogenase (short-subunit alcohol dehydrogenase family)